MHNLQCRKAHNHARYNAKRSLQHIFYSEKKFYYLVQNSAKLPDFNLHDYECNHNEHAEIINRTCRIIRNFSHNLYNQLNQARVICRWADFNNVCSAFYNQLLWLLFLNLLELNCHIQNNLASFIYLNHHHSNIHNNNLLYYHIYYRYEYNAKQSQHYRLNKLFYFIIIIIKNIENNQLDREHKFCLLSQNKNSDDR